MHDMQKYIVLQKKPEEPGVFSEFNAFLTSARFLFHGVLGSIFVSLLGSACHFAYPWSECNFIVGWLVSVNESVYEHLKLLIFPMLIWWLVITPFAGICLNTMPYHHQKTALAVSTSTAIWSGTTFVTVFFLIAARGLNYEHMWFNITIFVVGAFVGQCVGLWNYNGFFDKNDTSDQRFRVELIAALVTVTIVPYMVLTYNVPKWDVLWQDASNKSNPFYGVPASCQ